MTADGSTYAWPQSDVYVAKTSMDDYLSLDSPFHVYYMTISGHMPYNFNRVASKYRDLVEPLPYSETQRHIWPPPLRRTGCSRLCWTDWSRRASWTIP